MTLRTLDDLGDVAGSRVFVRSDFNVPLDAGAVADDARIVATLPTIRELRERGASVVLASHLGRPKGEVRRRASARTRGCAAGRADRGTGGFARQRPLPQRFPTTPSCCSRTSGSIRARKPTTRPSPGRLADLADAYVDDAFGAAHRSHASVSALPELMLASGRPAVAGRLMQREVEVLSRLLRDPVRPYVAILGGAKVSDKLAVIESLIDRVDVLLIGGAMAFTLIAADGGEIGTSLCERERFDEVRAARARARERGVLVEVPQDVVAAADASMPRRIVARCRPPRSRAA